MAGKSFQVRLPKYMASYVKRFEPAEVTDDNDKPTGKLNYGCAMIFPKGDAELSDPRKDETLMCEVKKEGKWVRIHLTKVLDALRKDSDDMAGMDFLRLFNKDRLSLRDGDEFYEEKPDEREAYKGSWFLNASDYVDEKKASSRPHGVVSTDRIPDGKGGKKLREIESDDEYYSGCVCIGSVTMKCNVKNNPHKINTFLNNVMVVEQGERLGGASSNAQDDFADSEFAHDVDPEKIFAENEDNSDDGGDDLLG